MRVARWCAVLACSVLISGAAPKRSRNPEPSGYRLGAISVSGYDPRANQLRPDLSARSWNATDLSLLAAVEVIGQPGSYSASRRVRIAVRKGRTTTQKSYVLGVLDGKSGRYYVPVWISGPFCEDVVIRASLVGQKEPSSAESKLEFRCGE